MINFESLIVLLLEAILIALLLNLIQKNKQNGKNSIFLKIWLVVFIVIVIVSWIIRYENHNLTTHLRVFNENENYYISNYKELDCSSYIVLKKDCEYSASLINRIIQLKKHESFLELKSN